MTQAEKLEALVRRAEWATLGNPDDIEFDDGGNLSSWTGYKVAIGPCLYINHSCWTWEQVLYNHDFARALFGEKEIDSYPIGELPLGGFSPVHRKVPAWIYHLQQAVISDDPIDYMYKAVFA